MNIWILIINDDSVGAFAHPFRVNLKPSSSVDDLRIAVEQKASNHFHDIDMIQVGVWKTRGKILDMSNWADMVKEKIDFDGHNIQPVLNDVNMEDLELADDEILLVQKVGVPQGTTRVSEAEDKVQEMKEFQRYKDTLANPGLSPSMASEYLASQEDITQVIYDGRGPQGGSYNTIGPPIQIFHPIFDDFTRIVNDPDIQPTVQDLKNVQDLMYDAGMLRKLHPMGRYDQPLCQLLRCILDIDISADPLFDTGRSEPGGVAILEVCGTLLPYMILTVQRELGKGGYDPTTQGLYDPTTQAGLYMRRSWVHKERQGVRERSCGPTFLVAAGGPWLCVLGGVFTDKIIVQRLTDMRSFTLSSTMEENRIYHNALDNARVLIALRECLKTLRIYYKSLNNSKPIPIVKDKPHPRFYPYPTSFTDRTQKTVYFKYVRSLEDHPACATYLAYITDKDEKATGDHVVVKFVESYGEKVHEFLAHRGWAPTLRYCGPFSKEIGLSGEFPGTQNAPPGLNLHPNIRMVVMDYIDALPWDKPPEDALMQINNVLTALHTNGYVFGGLRVSNILFDQNKKVKLIDFKWSGRYDTKDSKNLVDGLQEQIDGNMDRAEVGDGPYAHYPLAMSTIPDMWAPEMTPLRPIRPKHDRMMMDKLPY